jgi:hypothetical protein
MKHRISKAGLPVAALLLAGGGVLAPPAHATTPTYAELRAQTVAFVDDPFREFVLVSYVDSAASIDSPRNDRIADGFLDRYIDRVELWTEPGVPEDAGLTPTEAAALISLAEALKAA